MAKGRLYMLGNGRRWFLVSVRVYSRHNTVVINLRFHVLGAVLVLLAISYVIPSQKVSWFIPQP